MPSNLPTSDLDKLFVAIAASLDIPSHVYEDATLKYEDVGDWLCEEESELKTYSPEVYVQGSFRLGTVVRPLSDACPYDIDLVCQLAIAKENITQADLKELIGRRLRKRADLEKILSASRRCWVLDYPKEANLPDFHMDVLPAIPNTERPPSGILITDTELRHWQKSNPVAFSVWFYDRMRVVFQERRAALATSQNLAVEEVPDWQVKTPLQRVIQILKRHRDVHFENSPELRPVSIILTTLAARAYRNQRELYKALEEITEQVDSNWGKPGYVEYRNGKWWVANPVDDGENFADKWNEYPERREAFQRWWKKVRIDLKTVSEKQNVHEAVTSMISSFGRRTIEEAAQRLELKGFHASAVPTRSILVPALGDTQHLQQPQWPLRVTYKARVSASVHLRQHNSKKLWDLTDRSVPKKVWLRFAAKTNVPPPFDVRWQVVNTGSEAAAARQLRGDFYECDRGASGIRWESTAFSGTHLVEAFIIKDGICLARSGQTKVRIR